MIVIPSFELRGGQVVAPEDGAVLATDPVAAARALVPDGALFFHLVDLDAIDGSGDHVAVFERLVDAGLPFQVAGGIRDVDHAERLLAAGVDRVVVSSMVRDAPDSARDLAARFGPRAVAAVDVPKGGAVEDVDAALAHAAGLGFARVLVTVVDGGRPARRVDLDVLGRAVRHEGIEVFTNVLVDELTDLQALRPLVEHGLSGVVLATACRMLGVPAG